MITGVHHFSFSCSDADRSLAFYRDRLGLRLLADREVEAGGFVEQVTAWTARASGSSHLQGYGVNLELLQFRSPGAEPRARGLEHTGSAHVCFTTDDLDALYEQWRRDGVRFRSSGPVTVVGGPNDGGKGIYLDDPDGNGVEIIQLARAWPSAGNLHASKAHP